MEILNSEEKKQIAEDERKPPVFMSHSADIGKIAGALAKAQGAFDKIEKTREVVVKKKAGGQYTFKYAPLENIREATQKHLSANELAMTQIMCRANSASGVSIVLKSMLIHSSGEWFSAIVDIPRGEYGKPQEIGSALTYLRRYSTTALLNLATEDDDDGNLASGNEITKQTDSRPPGAPRHGGKDPKKKVSAAQLKRLTAIQLKNSWTNEQVDDVVVEMVKIKNRKELNNAQYDWLIGKIEKDCFDALHEEYVLKQQGTEGTTDPDSFENSPSR